MQLRRDLLFVGMSLLVAGCGGNDEPPAARNPDPPRSAAPRAKAPRFSFGQLPPPAAGSRSVNPPPTANRGTSKRPASKSSTPGLSVPSAPTEIAAAAPTQSDGQGYAEVMRPFLKTHCLRCHGPNKQEGDFRIDRQLPNDFVTRSTAEKWGEVVNMLNAGDMPPEGERQPPADQTSRVIEWITKQRQRAAQARGDGRVVMRRLNREEYNNTIRDLIGVDIDPADEFPEDAPASGFDNVGDALTISPLHLELYMHAAQKILDRAIVTEPQPPRSIRWRFQPEEGNQGLDRYRVNIEKQRIIVNAGNNQIRNGMTVLRTDGWDRGCGFRAFRVPHAGEYVIRIRAGGVVPAEAEVRRVGMKFQLDRQEREESKIANPQQRQRRRQTFDRYVKPYAEKHYAEDRMYRYGSPRLKLTGTHGGAQRVMGEFDVDAPLDKPKVYEVRAWFEPTVAGVLAKNVYHIPKHQFNFWCQPADEFPRPELYIDWMEIEGPVHAQWPPRSHQMIFIDSPHRGRDEFAYAREILTFFMRRAYRRPLRAGEVEAKLALFERVRKQKPSFEEAMKLPLTAVLASPHFLFLVEDRDQPGGNPQPLDDHELAARLSYFLWSSIPDDELFALAEQGKLRNPETLRTQVDRMLKDAKSRALVENFAGQWLRLREVGANPPVASIYPRYDDHLEVSMRKESETFFAHILAHDLSVENFLKSDFVTVNERLARFYDIPGVRGDAFRVVNEPGGTPRGGLVTQASILSVTSNGTRTSPVDRGVWILENLLGDPPPPPPPNAGDIPPGVPGLDKVTVRERLRLHREEAQCARCHNRIDPLGFALENFNAAGEWRTREPQHNRPVAQDGDPSIDATAQLPDGTRFEGVSGLQSALLKRSDEFLRCLAEKMCVYALGREPSLQDKPLIDGAVTAMKAEGKTLRSLIHFIVNSGEFTRK